MFRSPLMKAYRASTRSERTSRRSSPKAEWKASSYGFVFRDLHAITVPPLFVTPHGSASPPGVIGARPARRSESHVPTLENAPTRLPVCERTRTAHLLIASDQSGVAGVCRSVQFPHI